MQFVHILWSQTYMHVHSFVPGKDGKELCHFLQSSYLSLGGKERNIFVYFKALCLFKIVVSCIYFSNVQGEVNTADSVSNEGVFHLPC